MRRSKKIFLVFAGLFILILAIFSYDVSRRTTVPWQKKKSIEQAENPALSDSLKSPDIKKEDSN